MIFSLVVSPVPIQATGITDRQEVSRLRKKLSAMGCEWDLMWNVDKLRKEVISAIRSGKKVAIPSEFKSRVLRYVVYHVHVDRLECYDRSLQVGQFKLRLTLSCPGTQRPSIAWESDRAFLGSSCLKAEEGFFRLTVPVNLKASPDQLSAWRVEFEVLHKYPAAPIYSVVGRSWIDPPTLAQAEAIDVFSTFNRDNVIVRVNFTKTAHSCVGINLFKTVSLCVIFLARVGRLLALNRKREIVELEREVRVLNARSQTFYQAEHLALMTKTIETMNKYMESGSKPEDWLRAMQKAGVFGEEPERRIDAQISLLKAQIEGLRSDVMRSVIERPPPIVQIVSPEPRSPEIPDEPQAKPAGGLLGWFTGPGPVDVPPFPAELLSPKKEPPPSEAPSSLPPAAPAALGAPSGLSVKERMAAKPAVEARQKIIPRRATQAEPILTEPPNVNEEDQIEEEVEDAKEEEEPVEDMAAAVSNTVSSWWGAMTSAVAPEVTTARVNPAPLVAAVTKTPPPPPVVESVTKTPPVEVQAKKGASVVKKAVPAKKAGPPVKKTVVVPKQKVDPMKAKIEMIMKIKAIEAKRKAEIAVTEKAIVELAKSLPPIDKMKFIGLPGPPPFAPKAKASAAAQDTALPAALAPPPVAGNDEQLELIDEEDEQEAN